jgi:hypothetical protein
MKQYKASHNLAILGGHVRIFLTIRNGEMPAKRLKRLEIRIINN